MAKKEKVAKIIEKFEDLNKTELKRIIVYYNKEIKIKDYAKSSYDELLNVVKGKFKLDDGFIYKRDIAPIQTEQAIKKKAPKAKTGDKLIDSLKLKGSAFLIRIGLLKKKIAFLEAEPHGKELTEDELEDRKEEINKIKKEMKELESKVADVKDELKKAKESN